MSDEAPLSVSIKAGTGYEAPLVTIRADNPAELTQRLDAVKQLVVAGVTDLAVVLQNTYAAATGLGAASVVSEPTVPPQPSGWGTTAPTSPAPSVPAAPAPAVQQSGPFVKQDRWNNTFEYNLPEAPQTPRGPMVKATRQKRDRSGTYTIWLDPAHKACPLWREQGNPKVADSELVPDKWVN